MENINIPFNKPYLSGNELNYIKDSIDRGKISGDGYYTNSCQQYFQATYHFPKCLLTTSCTDALEMAAILIDVKSGDEVIAPSYTFVSTVNPFILRGAKIVFADSKENNPNIDEDKIEALITPKTKAIIIVHYAGMACNMEKLIALTNKYKLYLIEDAAQSFDSNFNNIPLGAFGAVSAFSFHETKNIISGEGGMLVINDETLFERAEIIREKGTNRSKFFRGEVDKYGWVDIGSSFLPSELIAAYLYGQLENADDIQNKRKHIWNLYLEGFSTQEIFQNISLPYIDSFASNNAHMFYIVVASLEERTNLAKTLKQKGIYAAFHYQALHKSSYYNSRHDERELANADRYTDCLLRLPLYYELKDDQIQYIIDAISLFYKNM